MTDYVVLLQGREEHWLSMSPEQRAATYGQHEQFAKALAERGHTILAGAELAPSREARVQRTDAEGRQSVTEGPYAESVEQLTGFYLVSSDDLDDLLEVCRILGDSEGVVEVRAAVRGSS